MSWSRDQVTLLIDEYKNHPCLYKVKHVQYKNKHARQDALERVQLLLKEIRPDVTTAEIKSKYSALRQNFLVEHRKFLNSQKSGAGSDQVYIPSIWYYHQMLFLVEHTTPREAFDSVGVPRSSTQQSEPLTNFDNTLTMNMEYDVEEIPDVILITQEGSGDSENNPGNGSCQTTPATTTDPQPTSKRRRRENSENEYFASATSAIEKIANVIAEKHVPPTPRREEDRVDAFLQYLGTKLRRINNNDILDEVEAEILNVVNKKHKS